MFVHGTTIAYCKIHSNPIYANIMPSVDIVISSHRLMLVKVDVMNTRKVITMSNSTMADIALALAKGTDLVYNCGNTFTNDTQRMLVCEAIQFRVNKDFRKIMKRHGEIIAKTIPIVYEQYTDGLISQAECLSSFLSSFVDSEYQEERDNAQALHKLLLTLEENLRKIHCPQSHWGKGCLISD